MNRLHRWAQSLMLLCAVSLPAAAGAATINPSDVTYVLSRGVLTLGEARFWLKPHGEPGCWRYQYVAEPSGLARLFIGEVSERSDFCVVDNELRSQSFEFKRADKSEDNFSLAFNWKDGTVRSSGGEMRALEAGMVDRLAMQIVLQNWVIDRQGQPGPEEITVRKIENKKVHAYRFRIASRETLQTSAGKLETVRVDRVDDPKKTTRFWLAPSRGYVAVRVEQLKNGDEQLKMTIK